MNRAQTVKLRLSRNGGLVVGVRPVYSAAMLAAGLPFVVEAHAAPRRGSIAARLDVASQAIGWSLEVGPGGWRAHEDSTVRPALEASPGLRLARLRLTARGETAEGEVTLVDPWHWPLDGESWPLLAAFVLPHDGVVTRLLAGVPSEERGLRGLFEAFRRGTRLTYSGPQVVRGTNGAPMQKLRPPWAVLRDLARGIGTAHCLDLSLLAAGMLEASGRAPVLCLALDEEESPVHAWMGCWRAGGRRFRPLLRGDALRAAVRSGELDLIDLVPVCRDRAAGHEEAVAAARSWVERAPDLLGVDVLALRPPHGRIAPYELDTDPVVLVALAESEKVARDFGAPAIDTSHLFCALLRADGGIARALLASIGSDLGVEIEACRPSTRGQAPVSLDRTRGFERCLAGARETARTAGSTILREVDLFWAVLGGRSTSLDRAFEARSGRRRALIQALAEISPPVHPESEA